MSEQIDWSKAPADATHWEPEGGSRAGWMKLENNIWYFWPVGKWDKYEWNETTVSDKRASTMCARPTTPSWSGGGLPPVGVVCEYHSGYVEQPFEYAQCEIIAHFEGEQSKKLAAFKYTAHDGVVQLGRGAPGLFRPIRTPEQIAADEREAAIKEMTANYSEQFDKLAGWAAYVYDTLGYRKP